MTKLGQSLVLALCLAPPACRSPAAPDSARPAVPIAAAPASAAPSLPEPRDASEPSRSVDFGALVGRCVVAEGYLGGGTKTGPTLLGSGWSIGLVPEGTQSVPAGARVRVRGVVAVHTNHAVFIQREGEPVPQGIPVPEGTDLAAARRRHVLEHAVVTAVRSRAEVEAALTSSLGKEVSLTGVVWSSNGHYWFNHDGVEVHVEGHEKLPGWHSLHGKVVVLRGQLARRPMPRIDQITLKPQPDLADAFVLGLREVTEPTESTVEPCPN